LAFVFCIGSASAEDDCHLQLAASLPITLNVYGHVTVPAVVGTSPVQLTLDTGSPISGLTELAAKRLALEPEPIGNSVGLTFYGGVPITHFVPIKDFRLGAMRAPNSSFVIVPLNWLESDGLLGADFIKQFDVDIDYAAGRLNLILPHRCPGRVAYWTADPSAVAIIPFTQKAIDPHIWVHVALDGHDMRAIVDTGASVTTMNLDTATEWFGLNEKSPGLETLGPDRYNYRFKALTLEGVTVNNPLFHLRPQSSSHFDNYVAILGNDVLRQLHVYIAYKEHKLYVTSASQN